MFMHQETGKHFFDVHKIAESYHLHLSPILGVNRERNMRLGEHDAYLLVIGWSPSLHLMITNADGANGTLVPVGKRSTVGTDSVQEMAIW